MFLLNVHCRFWKKKYTLGLRAYHWCEWTVHKRYTHRHRHTQTCSCWVGWHMPLVPALRRQRQENLRDFQISLVYTGLSRATQWNPVSKTNQQKTTLVLKTKWTSIVHYQYLKYMLNFKLLFALVFTFPAPSQAFFFRYIYIISAPLCLLSSS